jgi:hypothetical protein
VIGMNHMSAADEEERRLREAAGMTVAPPIQEPVVTAAWTGGQNMKGMGSMPKFAGVRAALSSKPKKPKKVKSPKPMTGGMGGGGHGGHAGH